MEHPNMNRKALKAASEAYRTAIEDGMVKVAIPFDSSDTRVIELCWAKRLSGRFARLVNCCVCGGDVNYGDVVEFREMAEPHPVHKEFVRVVSRGSRKWAVVYATPEERADPDAAVKARLNRRWRAIARYFLSLPDDERPLAWEGVDVGLKCVAFPLSLTESQLESLFWACPHMVVE
jgi:hypothetical protein